MSSTAVVAYESASLNDRMKYAQTLAAAGDLIPKGLWSGGAPSPGKVLLVMETGAMLGLHPMAAMQSIDVVEGRATLSAKLMSGLIRKAGHTLTIEKTGSIATGDYVVIARVHRSDTGEEFASEPWDLHRAIRAGMVDSYQPNSKGIWEVRARSQSGKPKPWEAHAEVMPVWRAVSEVSRLAASDVLFGLYSTEEMTDGGFPISDPDPEATEDWLALIAGAQTEDALAGIGARLAEKGEGTDKIRAAYRARSAVLSAEANTVDADVIEETTGGGEAAVRDHPEATGAHRTLAASGAQTPAEGASPSADAAPSAGSEMTLEEYEAAEAARFDAETGGDS
jgi:hypothetical protein